MNQQVVERRTQPEASDFSVAPAGHNSATEAMVMSRQAQEAMAAIQMAKMAPRDEQRAYTRIMNACHRRSLAETAMYAYPKGGQMVTGPSIRMAEVLARSWGNLDFGVVELEQKNGESQMMAYCWDLETNVRQTRIFTVKHERHTKRGVNRLDDPRDVYELTANQGARRVRACILGIIPGDVVEAAQEECERTLSGNTDKPLIDRVRSMVSAFSGMQVTQEMIEKRLGHNVDVTTEQELVTLRKIFGSLRDGMAQREQFFDVPGAGNETSEKASAQNEELERRRQEKQQADSKSEPVAKEQPAPAQDDTTTQPAEASDANWEDLVMQLSEKADCDPGAAESRLVAYCDKMIKTPLKKLDAEQIARVAKDISGGVITVKPE